MGRAGCLTLPLLVESECLSYYFNQVPVGSNRDSGVPPLDKTEHTVKMGTIDGRLLALMLIFFFGLKPLCSFYKVVFASNVGFLFMKYLREWYMFESIYLHGASRNGIGEFQK